MSTKIASLYAEITADASKFTQTMKGVKSETTSTAEDLKRFLTVFGSIATAALMIKKGLDETVGTFVKYAGEIRTLTQLTGESAEGMSALSQVAGDYGLTLDDLTTASKRMAKEGLSLNIETLAELSDEFLKLNTGAERQLFLTENLGAAGVKYVDILSQGGDAIRAQSTEISKSLILTGDAIAAANDYEVATRELTEAQEALKIEIGLGLIPPLVTVTEKMVLYGKYSGIVAEKALALERRFREGRISAVEYNEGIRNLGVSTSDFAAALEGGRGAMLPYIDMVGDLSTEYKELAEIDYSKTMSTFLGFADAYQASVENLQAAEEELALARSQGYGEGGAKIMGLKAKIEELQSAEELRTKQFIADQILMILAQGGLTEAENAAYLDYMEKSGLMSEEARRAADFAIAEAVRQSEGIQAAIDSISGKTVSVDVITNYYNSVTTSYTDPYANLPGVPAGSEGMHPGGGGKAGGGSLEKTFELNY